MAQRCTLSCTRSTRHTGVHIRLISTSPVVTKDKARNGLVTISPSESERHTATFIGPMHGLGDTNMGWVDVAGHLHTQLPYIKFVLPNAPTAPGIERLDSP